MTAERDLWTFTMRWFWLTILFVLALAIMTTAAWAAEPDEATKIAALKLGYALNGNSMVRRGSIDLSYVAPPPPIVVKTTPIEPRHRRGRER